MKLLIRLLAALILAGQAAPALSAPDRPLLLPGKRTLYQRVVAAPGARLHEAPAEGEGRAVTPFRVFYVYDRRRVGGERWLQVGSDRHGALDGWLPARDAIEWNQGLTLVFRDPAGHDRVLLFRDRQALAGLLREGDRAAWRQLYRQAVAGELPPDSPVVAIQPEGYVDIRRDFYLVPILDYRETWLGSEKARLLKVASVPLEEPAEEATAADAGGAPQAQPGPASPRAAEGDYSAGIVFVIDASLSMDEYIERTRQAVRRIYDQLGDSGQLGKVSFGLVAFRDNTRAVPGLDFVARTYVTLEEGVHPGRFLEKVAALKAAEVSSRDFREDAYAGVREAIEGMDWSEHEARFVVLITDAGAREGDDPLSTTGLGTDALRRLALDQGVALFVLHLLTPSEMADHERAAAQYRRLADYPGVGSLYYGVPTGDLEEFGQVVDALSQQLVALVARGGEGAAAEGEAARPEARAAAGDSGPETGAAENPRLTELRAKVAKLGYALRMRYLQQERGGIPRVFEAWMVDRDPADPAWQPVEVRVLLTRDQLSDLHDVLRQVLARAEEGLLSPRTFLDELKSLAATVSRDPERLGRTTATTAGEGSSLADLGLIGDYIEGLPYRGEVMELSLEDWQEWPARRQIEFLRRLEEKIAYYRALHDHTDLWISLDGGPVDGDSVFPLPLDMLP